MTGQYCDGCGYSRLTGGCVCGSQKTVVFRPCDRVRVVYAGRGHNKAMGYSYSCRIESRARVTWFGWGSEVVEYRFVVERFHMAWEDYVWGPWTTLEKAKSRGHAWLDDIEATPEEKRNVTSFYLGEGGD